MTTRQSQLDAIPTDLPHRRRRVFEAIASAGRAGMTADEVAAFLRWSVLQSRPRVTELYKAGLLETTGERRANASGNTTTVFRAKKNDPQRRLW